MLQCKTIEVRDHATFIACFAVLVDPSGMTASLEQLPAGPGEREADRFLLRRVGYPDHVPNVIMGRLDTGLAKNAHHDWNDRTMRLAHEHVTDNWDGIESGDVVDVEFLLGETAKSKESERHD